MNENAADLARRVLATVDSGDVAGMAAFFAPDGRFVFGNAAPAVGPAAIAASLGAFLSGVAGTSHRIVREWHDGAESAVEIQVTFTRHDGSTVVVPAVAAWRRDPGGLFAEYRVFTDLAPLFAA